MHPIRSLLWTTLLGWLLAAPALGSSPLPRPAALEPQVRFWTRIYSEVDRRGGLIHDSLHLGVVYEAIRIPDGLSARSQERRIEAAKDRYQAILRKLGSGKRSGLKPEEARVLALWPEGVTNATLRAAAKRVRFQLGQSDRFLAGLKRAGYWRGHIEAMLTRHRVPPQLVALPHVESSFNPAAYSRVGAAGLWQFTRSTGNLFMRVDGVVDERMDPFIASDAAARLLRSNYEQLGTWPLAITAYNHGTGGMRRAVRQLGTNDISVIVQKYKQRSFGFASRNFYAEFLAALDVDRNAERFFGPIAPADPVDYDRIRLDHFYTARAVEQALGIDSETLREHNRSLRPAVWNGAKYLPRGFELRVPRAATSRPIAVAIASIPDSQRFAAQHRDRLYKVRRGDTLSKIARRYHVKERDLVALNNLRSRHQIRQGQVLTLPDEKGSEAPRTKAPVSIARAEPPSGGIYRVQSGDTISTIANRFGLTEARLVALNGLRNRNLISVGQPLRVADAAIAAAVTEPKPPPEPAKSAEVAATPESPAVQPAVEPESLRVAEVEPEIRRVAAIEPETLTVAAVEPEILQVEAVESIAAALDAPAMPEPILQDSEPVDPIPVIPAADPSDYSVTPNGRITVQAAETLGHYAEWLEVPARRLRQLNRMSYGTPLVIGRQKKLDFSHVTPETFETRRLEYHHAIQESFFDAYDVIGTDTHLLRPGDTLWQLAEQRYRIPVWLLRQYNPALDFGALQAGTRLIVPRVAPRSG